MIHTDWWRTTGNVKNIAKTASCRNLAAQAAVRRSGRRRRERGVEPCLSAIGHAPGSPEVMGSTAWARTALSLDDPAGPIVLDTKWKRLDDTDDGKLGVAQEDVYQMLVYGQAYGAERLVLLHPWLPGLAKGVNRSWRVQSTRTSTVDVGEPSNVSCALREIVRAA